MKIMVVSVGVYKTGPMVELWRTYKKRISWPLELVEIPAPKHSTKDQEALLILEKIPAHSQVILLDEKGDNMKSTDFADLIRKQQLTGLKILCFVIGGADGLGQVLMDKAHKILSFGAQTWPHALVRVLLIEQLYRAQQILSNHPYHRA